VNNNFMRPGQHKNNNNRNRNRNNSNNNNRRNTGGGGSPNNKVFDSNGPDVKLRGTTQTIAEKYMQMGRDAQSSGDSVAAESYYQHAEHYYRLWAASQPVGQSLVMPRKMGEEEYDEEGEQINSEEDSGAENGKPESPQQVEGAEPFDAGSTDPNFSPPLAEGQQRNNRNNNYTNNRDGNSRNNNRNRWQNRRNERYDANGNVAQDAAGFVPATEGATLTPEVVSVAPITPVAAREEHSGQWEAPSFLQRPTPVMIEPPASETMPAADAPAPRRARAPRKPRVEAEAAITPADESSSSAE
jgi:Domain of unknown function (DUF4167)